MKTHTDPEKHIVQEGASRTHRPRQSGNRRGAHNPGANSSGRRRRLPTPAAKVAAKSGFPAGMIVMAALGVLFVCYLTNTGNVQVAIDAFFGAQVNSAHTHDAQIGTWFLLLLPYVAMALVVAVLYVLLASMGVGKQKRKPQSLTEQMTVHEFAELAHAAGVGVRVSREMYRMLLSGYANRLRSTLTCPFAEKGTSSETVWAMFEELVAKSGGVIRGRVGVEALATPMEMMQAAEQCVERAAIERRAALPKATVALEETHRTIIPLPAGRR